MAKSKNKSFGDIKMQQLNILNNNAKEEENDEKENTDILKKSIKKIPGIKKGKKKSKRYR